jgi:hypothetical protein
MHTTEGKTCRFIHNGDYLGEVIVVQKKGKLNKQGEVVIEFEDIAMLVTQWLVAEKIAKLEQLEPEELLKLL